MFYSTPKLVIYVPGYLSGDNDQKEVLDYLKVIYPNSAHIVFTWDSVGSWKESIKNSIEAGRRLYRYIVDLPTFDVTLIAHSLGANVVNESLKLFNSPSHRIKQSIFLGAAISSHTDLYSACESCEYPLINLYNSGDAVLATAYAIAEKDDALGFTGIQTKAPSNYRELDIDLDPVKIRTSNLLDVGIEEISNRFLDATGHSASRVYLKYLYEAIH